MSNVIDERVVSMKFDNSGFSKNVESSINSLNNLNNSISNLSSVRGLKDLGDNLGKINLGPLSDSIDSITSKFSAWGIAGITALQNITNKAVDAGIAITKSLTIDPVSTGFAEYEEKMGSVQTIMNAGYSLKETKDALEDLNLYADQTIYSFADMTSNISKFTNQGVKLQTATAAMKGISNVAALAGANSAQASHAMYNFAQALGQGYVALIDWKSIKNATMDTQDFKAELIKTAKELGTLEETAQGTYYTLTTNNKGDYSDELNFQNLFNNGLQFQWMTNDVLMKTLEKFSDASTELGKKAYAAATDVKTYSMLLDTLKEAAQSGWSMSMEYIVGDFEQAKKLWSAVNVEISDLLNKSADERNKLLKTWNEKGGRDAVLSSIANVWKTFLHITGNVNQALREIFPKTTSAQLINFSKNIENITKKLREFVAESEFSKKVVLVFKGVFGSIKKIKDGFVNLISTIKSIAGVMLDAWKNVFPDDVMKSAMIMSGFILKIGASFNNVTIKIKEFINQEENLSKIKDIFTGLFSIVDLLRKSIVIISKVFVNLLNPILSQTSTLSSVIINIAASIGRFLTALNNGITPLSNFQDLLNRVSENFKTFISNLSSGKFASVRDVLINGIESIKNSFLNFSFDFKVNDSFGSNLISKLNDIKNRVIELVSQIFDQFSSSGIFNAFLKDIESVLNLFSSLGDALSSALGFFQAFFDGLADSMRDTPLLTLATVFKGITSVINSFNSGKILVFASSFFEFFDNIADALDSFKFSEYATSLKEFATGIAILTGSLFALSLLDAEQINNSLGTILIMMGSMVAMFSILAELMTKGKFLQDISNGLNMQMVGDSLVKFAAAIAILSGSLFALSSIGDPDALLGGFAAIISLMASLVIVAALIDQMNISSFNGVAVSMLLMSVGISALASSIAELASVPSEQLVYGLLAFTALIAELVIALKLLNDSNIALSTAAGLIAMAVAMNIVVSSISKLGEINVDQLTQGFLSFALILLGLLAFTALLPASLISDAIALLIMVAAIDMLTIAIKSLGGMKFTDMLKGLVGVAAGITILVVACSFMTAAIPGALAMLIVSVGLIALAAALIMIGNMSLAEIGKGLLGLAGGLTILAVALTLMVAAIPGAVALTIASVGLLAMAGALILLSTLSIQQIIMSLVGLAATLGVLAAASMLLFPIMPLMAALAGILTLLGVGVLAAGAGLWLLSEALGNLATTGAMGVTVLASVCAIIASNLIYLAEFGVVLYEIDLALILFGTACSVCGVGITLLSIGLLTLSIGLLAVAGASVVLIKAFNYILDMLPVLLEKFKNVVVLFKNAGSEIVEGIKNGIKNKISSVKNAVTNLGKTILDAFRKKLKIHSPSKETESDGKNTAAGFIKGVEESEDDVSKSMFNLGSIANMNFKDGLGELLGGKLKLNPDIEMDSTIDASDVELSDTSMKLDMDDVDLTGDKIDVNSLFDDSKEGITLDNDLETDDLYKSLMSGDTNSVKLDNLDLTSSQNNLTSAIQGTTTATQDQTEAIKEQTEATKELKYTRDKVLEDYEKNGSNINKGATKEQLFDNWIDEMDFNMFNKFFDEGNFDMEDIKRRTQGTLTDIADIFRMFQAEFDESDETAGEALYDAIWRYNAGTSTALGDIIKDLESQGKTNKDDLLNALGFGSVANVNRVFESIKNSALETSDAITDTTKKATISASELEQKAKDVIAGKYGNGADRVKALGDEYAIIQNRVNEMLGSSVRHETDMVVAVDDTQVKSASSSLDELDSKTEAINKKNESYQKKLLENQEKLPTAVKDAIKAQMSYQDKVLQNESKIPTEVANKLKAINDESNRTADSVTETGKKATETLNDFSSYLENVKTNAEEMPESIPMPKVETKSNDTTEIEVSPKFNLTNVDTSDLKEKITDALDDILKAYDAKEFNKTGKDLMKQFIEGIKSEHQNVSTTARMIMATIVGIFNPKEFKSTGEKAFESLKEGIKSKSETIVSTARSIAKTAVDSIMDEFDRLKDIDFSMLEGPTVSPVLNMSGTYSRMNSLSSRTNTNMAANISTNFRPSNQNAEMNNMAVQFKNLNNKFDRMINSMERGSEPSPVNVNVSLQGDAKNLFKTVQREGQVYTRTTGRRAFN